MSAPQSLPGGMTPESSLQALGGLGRLGGAVTVLSPLLLFPAADDVPLPVLGYFLLAAGLLIALGLLRNDRGRHLPSFLRGMHRFRLGALYAGIIQLAYSPAGEWLTGHWLDRPWLTGWDGGLLLAGLTFLCALAGMGELGWAVVHWPQPPEGARFGPSVWQLALGFALLPLRMVRTASGSGVLPLFLAGVCAPRPLLVQAALVVLMAELVITLTARWLLNDLGMLVQYAMTMARMWPRYGDALARAWAHDRLRAGITSHAGPATPDYTLLILVAAQATGAPDSRIGRRQAANYRSLCQSMLLAAETSLLTEPGIEGHRQATFRRLHLAARGTVSIAFATVADCAGATDDAIARSGDAVRDLEAAGCPDFAALMRFQWAERLRDDYPAVREVLRPITEGTQGKAWMAPYAHRRLAHAARSGLPERVAFHERAEADGWKAHGESVPKHLEVWAPRPVVPSLPDAAVRSFERMTWAAWQEILEHAEPVSWTPAPDEVRTLEPVSGLSSVDQTGLHVDGIRFFGETRASMSTAWNLLSHAQLLARARRLRTARWMLERALVRSDDAFLQQEALALLASIHEEMHDWAAAYARWSELVRLEETRRGNIGEGNRRISFQAAHYSRLILLLTSGIGRVPDLPAPPSAVAFEYSERDRSRVLLESLHSGHRADTPATTTDHAELTRLLNELEQRSGQRTVLACCYVFNARIIVFIIRPGGSSPAVEQGEPPLGLVLPDAADRYGRLTSGAAFDQDRLNADFGPLAEALARHCDPGELLCLAPYGLLHEIPLHAVTVGDVPLAVRNPVHVVPSASILASLYRDTAPPPPRDLCIFADSRTDLPLVHARAEARSMARMYGERSQVVFGSRVTRRAVLARLAGSRATAVHFACHGVLAPDDTAGSAISCADGPLTTDDLLGLRIRADLVTLSACRSGAGRGRPGDERLGLARAFLLAGAKTVLVTQWQVDDLSTELFMERFYELLLAGAPRGQAFHAAQARVRDMTMNDAMRWCENALTRTDGEEAGAAERTAYESALLRLLCESGDLSAAERQFDHLKRGTPRGSPARRELVILWSRLMAGARAGRKTGPTTRPFAHPYFWAPFVLIGDAR